MLLDIGEACGRENQKLQSIRARKKHNTLNSHIPTELSHSKGQGIHPSIQNKQMTKNAILLLYFRNQLELSLLSIFTFLILPLSEKNLIPSETTPFQPTGFKSG